MNDLAAKKVRHIRANRFSTPKPAKGPKNGGSKTVVRIISFAGIEMVALLLVQKKLMIKKAAFGTEITACNRRL